MVCSAVQLLFLHHYNVGLFIVPGPPLEFIGSSNSSTTITLTWKPPLLIRVIANYTLQCFTEGEKVLNISLNGSLTTTTLSGLLPNTNYSCNITAYSSVGGRGSPATTTVTTLLGGKQSQDTISTFSQFYTKIISPTHEIIITTLFYLGQPAEFMGVSNSSTMITFTWKPPLHIDGIVTNYTFQCSTPGDGVTHNLIFNSSQITTTLSGLLPYTSYSCNITAHTSVGRGPAATTSVVVICELLKIRLCVTPSPGVEH